MACTWSWFGIGTPTKLVVGSIDDVLDLGELDSAPDCQSSSVLVQHDAVEVLEIHLHAVAHAGQGFGQPVTTTGHEEGEVIRCGNLDL